jgi:hypothetical protein
VVYASLVCSPSCAAGCLQRFARQAAGTRTYWHANKMLYLHHIGRLGKPPASAKAWLHAGEFCLGSRLAAHGLQPVLRGGSPK